MILNTPRKLLVTCYALAVTTFCTVYVPHKAFQQAFIKDHMQQWRCPSADTWVPLWSRSKDYQLVLVPDITKLAIVLVALTVLSGFMFMLLGWMDLTNLSSLRKYWRVPDWIRTRENRQTLYALLAAAAIIASFGLAYRR